MEHLDDVRFVGFNQDHTCLAIGTAYGFRIMNTYPIINYYSRGKGINRLPRRFFDRPTAIPFEFGVPGRHSTLSVIPSNETCDLGRPENEYFG